MARELKRQILRQAVDENLSAIEGRRPTTSSPRGVLLSPAGRHWPWVLALGLLAVSLVALALLRPLTDDRAARAVSEPGAAAVPEPGELADDFTSQLRFPAPRPIDPSVFPLEIRTIVLDPGHGGEDFGTTGGDLAEKNLTLDIARRLRDRLVEGGFQVQLTRDEDRLISLKERGAIANRLAADLFVSIHINWLSTRQVRGIETYYLGPTEDPRLIALARRENRRSGFLLAEMRPILERLYTDIQQEYSHDLASRVQRALFTSLRRVNPELENRGVKTAPFVVLVSSEMPAILAEVSCLSNADEAELLARPLYRDHIADALARGIKGFADDIHQTEQQTEQKGS